MAEKNLYAGIFKNPHAGSPTVGEVLSQFSKTFGGIYKQPTIRADNRSRLTMSKSLNPLLPGDFGYQFPPIPTVPSMPEMIRTARMYENLFGNNPTVADTRRTSSTSSFGDRGKSTTATSPNTIVQAADDEYRQQLAQYSNQAAQARTALKGFQPGSGPMPAAATQALQTGRDIWAQKYKNTLARPGGMVGTYNPLMQARGDVPSMADLQSGMRSIQATTAGPGRTSEDVTDAAMQKAAEQGRYFAPESGPDPLAQQKRQQMQTAFQAAIGTEGTSAAQRAQDFLAKTKINILNPGSYNFPGYDAAAMMNAPSASFK